MAIAAAEYAKAGASTWRAKDAVRTLADGHPPPVDWPWATRWWKPKDRVRNLERAGALIIAELERIERNALPLQSEINKVEP